MNQCKTCLYTNNHPLGISFNEEGICSGCTLHFEKNSLDWNERKSLLRSLTDVYRGSGVYDCIIPVSGGQDSFFTVHYVVNELKLRPLLVNFNRIFNSREGIFNLHQLRSRFGLDLYQLTLNPLVARRVIQTTLSNLGTLNWFWIAGQTSLPVRMARDLNVPLVIWGAHQGVEQVGMFSHLDNVEMTRRYRKEHDLMGIDEGEIFKYDCAFKKSEITQLAYPSDKEIIEKEIRGIYLSNFVRWDPYEQHKFVSRRYGYKGRLSSRTYYKFDNPDCVAYMSLQDELKQTKFGYGKVTDQLCREIRHGRITKEEALVKNAKYLSKTDKRSIFQFLSWLGANERVYELLKLNFSPNFTSSLNNFVKAQEIGQRKVKERKDKDFDVFGKGIFT